jgi:quercetin dioxygenase-like cupin family protein
MTGTLDSHMRICRALEIALPDLYRNMLASSHKIEVQTKKTRTDVFIHDKKAASEILAPNVLNKKMMPTMIKIARSGNTHKEETKPGIEKFVYVLDGKVEAVIGEDTYGISKGDTLYFESSVPHFFRNTGAADARMICVVCPPVL